MSASQRNASQYPDDDRIVRFIGRLPSLAYILFLSVCVGVAAHDHMHAEPITAVVFGAFILGIEVGRRRVISFAFLRR